MDDAALESLEKAALKQIKRAKSHDAIAALRVAIFGKKGSLSQLRRGMRDLSAVDRPKAGQRLNAIAQTLETALDTATQRAQDVAIEKEIKKGRYDVSLPGRRMRPGAPHPLRIVESQIIQSLGTLGFTVAQGPLVEHDWYNFEALNIPEDHPARDMQDTFFVAERIVLRTHTSNVQIRTMTKQKPPVRILAPGMVFRHDDVDPTHSPVFHQIEGLWIDSRVTFSDLKGVLRKLAADLFGQEAQLRFRPSFFPFTEPSAEIDVSCVVCSGTGNSCRVCRGTGWLEILGAGLVHPTVLEAVGYNPDEVQGFAFGAGMERIAMLRWAIDDIRLFYENDVRFLQQFIGAS